MENTVKILDITKQFKNFRLEVPSLTVESGSYFALLGPTGSGKSLILSILAGVYKPDTGIIVWAGNDITHLAPEKRNFGVVYQNSSLFPHLDVEGNIGFSLSVRRTPAVEKRRAVLDIMTRLGIEHLSGRMTQNLSGGEGQRVALARALIMKPPLLLLDEPFSSLDAMTRIEMITLMRQVKKEFGPTVIHITHDFEEAMGLADSCAVVNHGRVIDSGSITSVFGSPKDIFTAHFTGARNIYSGRAGGQGDDVCFITDSGVSFYVGRAIDAGSKNAVISPDDVILSPEAPVTSARNIFKGRVTAITRRPGIVEVTIDMGISIVSRITPRSINELAISAGSEIFIIFKGNAVHIF